MSYTLPELETILRILETERRVSGWEYTPGALKALTLLTLKTKEMIAEKS